MIYPVLKYVYLQDEHTGRVNTSPCRFDLADVHNFHGVDKPEEGTVITFSNGEQIYITEKFKVFDQFYLKERRNMRIAVMRDSMFWLNG